MKEDYIKRNKNKIKWEWMSKRKILSENLMREFKDYVNWHSISIFQDLSEDFIKEMKLIGYFDEK